MTDYILSYSTFGLISYLWKFHRYGDQTVVWGPSPANSC